MTHKIIRIAACLIVVSLLGCVRPTDTPTPTLMPTEDVLVPTQVAPGPPLVLDVTSLANDKVLVLFNQPLGSAAGEAALYQITRPQACDAQDWPAALGILKAEPGSDGDRVTLTTNAQSGVNYQLSVTGVSSQGPPLTFTGTAPTVKLDSDGDGITDADEQYGWSVRIGLSDGTSLCKYVTSDPAQKDTDQDGLVDNLEIANATNPRSPDTDSDDLGDSLEAGYGGSPRQQDTDGDGIADGVEANLYHTSPALKDSDGDGVEDDDEIVTGGRNPRLADLPRLDLQLYGSPAIVLNVSEGKVEKQISSSLEQDSSAYQRTDTESTRMAIENTVSIHTEVEAGTSNWPPSANAKMTTDTQFSQAMVNETSSSWTKNSMEELKNSFEKELNAITSYNNGIIAATLKLVNSSNLTVKLTSPRVIAYRMLPGGSFTVIGALEPGKIEMLPDPQDSKKIIQHWQPAGEEGEYLIGPGGTVTLVLGAGDLPAQVMKPLMQNPSALMFEIGSYSLYQMDELGAAEVRSYDRVGEDVLARTGLIVIDYGDGRVERYAVAANLGRNLDGSGSGLTMKDALTQILGMDYQTAPAKDGRAVLARLGNELVDRDGDGKAESGRYQAYPKTETRQAYGYWLVAGTPAVFQTGQVPDFDQIVINSGDRLNLVWVEDQDGDGLTDREEYLLGTDIQAADSDADGLSDYAEAKEGWTVAVTGKAAYPVLPDARYADSDGDGWNDQYEWAMATDPLLSDTDADTVNDPGDVFPLSGPCLDLSKNQLGLVAWWIPVSDTVKQNAYLAFDNWPGDGSQTGTLIGYNPALKGRDMVTQENGGVGFSLNRGLNDNQQYIQFADHKSISPEAGLTIAAWITWDRGERGGAVASGADRGTLLDKGSNYALYVTRDGRLQFTLQRYVWEKCWLPGCDGCCADKNRNSSESLTTRDPVILPGVPAHVVVTFGKDTEQMHIYVNGEEKDAYNVRNKHKTSGYWYERFTKWLLTNKDLLTIGNTPDGKLPFKGTMMNIQFFNQGMNADDVGKLYQYGLCEMTK